MVRTPVRDVGLAADRAALGRIRVRLALWYTGLFTLSLLFVGVAVYGAVRLQVMSEVRFGLSEKARATATSPELNEELEGPPKVESEYRPFISFVLTRRGRLMKADMLSPGLPDRALFLRARSGSDGFATVISGGGEHFLVYAVPVVRHGSIVAVVEAAAPISNYLRLLQTLATTFVVAALVAGSLGTVAGLFLAGRALVPIRLALARQREFVTDASHELRTPLATIRTSAELGLRAAATDYEEQTEALRRIVRQTDHLTHLVADLSTLARADSGQIDLAIAPLGLHELIASCAEEAEPLAQAKGVRLTVTSGGPLTVEGDEQRLRQVLWILLDNAIKYTSEGGEVTVAWRRQGERAMVAVADTGVGIPPDELPHVFDRFYRGAEARGVADGTGLGLAIAYWIAQAHGGGISASSPATGGAVFTVWLPLGSRASRRATPHQAAEA